VVFLGGPAVSSDRSRPVPGTVFERANSRVVGPPTSSNSDGGNEIQVRVTGRLVFRYMTEVALTLGVLGKPDLARELSVVARVIRLSSDEALLVFPGYRIAS
jgi:hypothetical protein